MNKYCNCGFFKDEKDNVESDKICPMCSKHKCKQNNYEVIKYA